MGNLSLKEQEDKYTLMAVINGSFDGVFLFHSLCQHVLDVTDFVFFNSKKLIFYVNFCGFLFP